MKVGIPHRNGRSGDCDQCLVWRWRWRSDGLFWGLVLPCFHRGQLCSGIGNFTLLRRQLGRTLSATLSVGLAMLPAEATSFGDLLAAADRAVYEAKRRGRKVLWAGGTPGLSIPESANYVAGHIDRDGPIKCFIDVTGGYGAGVYDILVERGYGPEGRNIVVPVNFGGAPLQPARVSPTTDEELPGPLNRRAEIWLKLWGNLTFNPISALTHSTLVDICQFPLSRELAAAMMREAEAVATSLGISFRVSLEKRIAGAEKVGKHKTSMLQDVESGRDPEIDALVGAVIELGKITQVPTPHIETVYALMKLLSVRINDEKLAVRAQPMAAA